MKESEKITAEQVLKQKGFYFVMPRPYTNENVIGVMQEFANLKQIELLQEMVNGLQEYKDFYPEDMFPEDGESIEAKAGSMARMAYGNSIEKIQLRIEELKGEQLKK
jgi:hypothetical protein